MMHTRRILWFVLLLLLLALTVELLFRRNAVLSSWAETLFKHERYEEAAKIYQRNGEHADAAANLAKSRYKQGKYEEAEGALENAISKNPNEAEYYYDRGNIDFKNEEYKSAVENYEKAIILDNTDEDAKANLELALKKLQDNPPPQEPELKEEKQQNNEEEVRNILEALDNMEVQERKNKQQDTMPKTDNWW
ncbi:MAG: tetratricopeptide repeat protein [Candidatus Cloacimonetes bacterium]|nr:tetratricopeptide repeat protein [Candidatus Cloacimonadota bacterium]